MPARNEPCACGSGTKYKRCCLPRLEAVRRELAQRDDLVDEVIAWAEEHHAETLEEASRETSLIRLLGGRSGRNMSVVWAITDYAPADGGPPVQARFAERAELDPSMRTAAEGLADARLDVYRVCATIAGAWFEIEPLVGGERARIPSANGFEALVVGDVVVGRVVLTTTIPTIWGSAKSFRPDTERRWLAQLAELPADRANAGLEIIGFEPDDAVEPLPDGLDTVSRRWAIADAEDVIDAIEEDDVLECVGQATSGRWAFGWFDEADCGAPDLGGRGLEDDGEIEVARLIVAESELTLVSGARETLEEVAAYVEATFDAVIGRQDDALAA